MVGGDVKACLALSLLLTVAGELIGDKTLGLVLTPIVSLLLIYSMWRVPVRYTMLTLLFCAFALPNPAEGQPAANWPPPFSTVGALLLTHLNTVDPALSFGVFSGMDIILILLGVVIFLRKSSGSQIDVRGNGPSPKPLLTLAWVSVAGTLYAWMSGLLRGGEFRWSLWQVNGVIYLPFVFLLFQYSLRIPKDLRAIARVVLSAALYKAMLAVYVYYTIRIPPDPETGSTHLAYATSHADSILFADAILLISCLLLERVVRKGRWKFVPYVAILLYGMVANNRRLVWVHVLVSLLVMYLITSDNIVKRYIRRALVISTPIAILYVLIGWNSTYSSVFKPIRVLRSVIEAKSDASSYWRELENYDLVMTIKQNPIFGLGFGHGYIEVVKLPHVNYSLERYSPHNSILGLWCYCGYFGFAALTMLWVAGIYFAMRCYNVSKEGSLRAAAIATVTGILVYLMHCWGDLGLSTWTGVFSCAVSIAVAGKLAIASGAWPSRPIMAKNRRKPPSARSRYAGQ